MSYQQYIQNLYKGVWVCEKKCPKVAILSPSWGIEPILHVGKAFWCKFQHFLISPEDEEEELSSEGSISLEGEDIGDGEG